MTTDSPYQLPPSHASNASMSLFTQTVPSLAIAIVRKIRWCDQWFESDFLSILFLVNAPSRPRNLLFPYNEEHAIFSLIVAGSDSAELATTSNQEDEVNFYQATSADVAKLFHIDLQGKQPSLVLLKEDDEKLAILVCVPRCTHNSTCLLFY
ncbi:hypothetical protein L1887_14428 [Cichorium endivia]|nr:hypothetical protein L1887_14428 [Cichorium endivia]